MLGGPQRRSCGLGREQWHRLQFPRLPLGAVGKLRGNNSLRIVHRQRQQRTNPRTRQRVLVRVRDRWSCRSAAAEAVLEQCAKRRRKTPYCGDALDGAVALLLLAVMRAKALRTCSTWEPLGSSLR